MGFLKDQVITDYYKNRSSNQLLSYPLPIITGFDQISDNLPATVQNTSWEFMVNTVNVKSKNFTWTSSFNLNIPNNKLIAFPGIMVTQIRV